MEEDPQLNCLSNVKMTKLELHKGDGDNVANNPLLDFCVKLDNSDSYNLRCFYSRSGENRLQLWSFWA